MTITDQAAQRKQRQNTTGYAEARRDFAWNVPEDYNFAFDAVGRWAEEPEKLAMLWLGPDGREERYTFAYFDEQSSRVAHALKEHGVAKGEPVLLMLPRVPEWWETMLGLMKLGAVGVPCTTLLTPQDLRYRAETAQAIALVTDRAGAEKWAQVRAQCPSVRLVMVVGEPGDDCPEQCVGYHPATDVASPVWYDRVTRADDPCLIYFTIGTVGFPKMVLHSHASYPAGHTLITGRYWLDLGPDDPHGTVSEMGWANFLESYFDALPPAPSHWCPLNTATPDTPASDCYFLLDQACRIVPGASLPPARVPSSSQGQVVS